MLRFHFLNKKKKRGGTRVKRENKTSRKGIVPEQGGKQCLFFHKLTSLRGRKGQ